MVVRLRELRGRAFMSQRQLAEASGVAAATIVRIEQEQVYPNGGTIRKLAAALGVEPTELVPDPIALAEARRRDRKKKGAAE